MTAPTPVTLSLFGAKLRHGFFGRAGGLSQGLYRGLNCGFGSGDDEKYVAANRARVAGALDIAPERLLTVYQTHSPDVLTVTEPHTWQDAPKADAMVTAEPGLGLAILTADCAPILLADEAAGVIGAAHAGWKGALGGVIENTVEAMIALGADPERIHAAIGPTISQANYEVDDPFRSRFCADDATNKSLFAPSPKDGHCHFDLPAYCAKRLRAAGLREIGDTALCTYADEENYFSYRRSVHRGQQDYGRNVSVIVLAP